MLIKLLTCIFNQICVYEEKKPTKLIRTPDNMWYIRDLKFKPEPILVAVENWTDARGFRYI